MAMSHPLDEGGFLLDTRTIAENYRQYISGDFAQLYAPPLMDPVFGFQAVNIEAQLRTPTSLLAFAFAAHRLGFP